MCANVVLSGDCIATAGSLAVSEWLDISLLVSSRPGLWHQHWAGKAVSLLVSCNGCFNYMPCCYY